jgi:hypothetical protein
MHGAQHMGPDTCLQCSKQHRPGIQHQHTPTLQSGIAGFAEREDDTQPSKAAYHHPTLTNIITMHATCQKNWQDDMVYPLKEVGSAK